MCEGERERGKGSEPTSLSPPSFSPPSFSPPSFSSLSPSNPFAFSKLKEEEESERGSEKTTIGSIQGVPNLENPFASPIWNEQDSDYQLFSSESHPQTSKEPIWITENDNAIDRMRGERSQKNEVREEREGVEGE